MVKSKYRLSSDKGKNEIWMGKKVETWAQLQAQPAAEAFKDRISLIAHLAMDKVEKVL